MDNIYGAYEDEGCFIPSSGTVSPSNPFNSGIACAPCVDGAVFPLVPVVDDSECDTDPSEQLRRLAVNPPDLFFGAISGVDYPTEQTAIVRNTGDIPIGIQSVTISNPVFTLVDFIPPSVVNPGSQFNIKIRYYSAYIGQDLGQVVIDTDQDRPPYTIGLSGRVVSNLLDVDFETALATINGAVALAEQAAQDAITAAIGAGNSGITAAGYAELSGSYANIATGEASAAHAQAVAAQSFSTTSGNWATASASSAETAVTKANDAGASAAAAEISRLAAVAANATATAQAGIATTKALEANASASSALSSETLSSTYATKAQNLADLAWPSTFSPEDRVSYEWLLGNSANQLTYEGPNTWPSPYLSSLSPPHTENITQLTFKKWKPRPINGRRVRLTCYIFSYATNIESAYLWIKTNQTPAYDGTDNQIFAIALAPGGENNIAPNTLGFRKLSAEFVVDNTWQAHWKPIVEVKAISGAPSNGLVHFTGILTEDATGEILASSSAIASATSATLADAYRALAETNSLLSAQYSTGGGNELISSELVYDTTGWTFNQSGTSHLGARNYPDTNWFTQGANTLGLYQSNNNGADIGYWFSEHMPAKPLEWNEASGLLANHRSTGQILLRYSNAAKVPIADGDFYSGVVTDLGRNDLQSLDKFTPAWAKGQAPAGTVYKQFIMIKHGTLTGANSYGWMCQPQVRKVPANSTSPAIYSPASGKGELNVVNAAVVQAASAAASANAAQAQVRTDLTAAIAGNTATLGIHASTLATLNGKTDSRFVVSAITPGGVAQLSIYSNSDTGAGIELIGNVRINGNLVVDKSITWNQVATSPGQFSNEASAGWSGSYTPIHGETFNIPAVVSLYTVKPSGRFFYELGINFTTNLGVRETISIGGKPAYTDFVASDSGIGVFATDPNGNVYTPINGVNRPILATAAFNAHFVPYVRRGSLEQDYQDMGDYYRRQVAAQYTVTSYFLRVVWTAF